MFTWGPQQLVAAAFDPFFANVLLLLHGDGANGSTSFIDSSPTPKTMSVFGGASLSTANKRFGSAALSFPTGSSFSQTPSIINYDLAGADFTIECWTYFNALGSDTHMVAKWLSGGDSFMFGTNGSALIFRYVIGGTQFTASAAGAVGTGSWMHLAVTRSDTTLRLFANGVLVHSQSISGAISYSAASSLFVGFGTTANMLLDEVRLTKGIARYTANFTPPSEPFPDVGPPGVDPLFANVSLLLHLDGANGATVFTDSGPLNKTVTHSGGAVISTAQSRFGGASLALDGVDDYLSVANNAGLSLNGVDFAVEGFARWAAGTSFQTLIDFRGSGAFNSSWAIGIDTGNRTLFVFNGVSNATIASTAANSLPAAATWFHWAVTRAGTTLRLFIDGALGATVTFNPPATSATGIRIGINHDLSGDFSGFMDELRITNGAARYTANFTPPSEPFPDVGPPGVDPLFANVVLLLHGEDLTDSSQSPKTLTAIGGAAASEDQKKYGSKSLAFNGSSQYITLPAVSDFRFGAGDFTIEAWVYQASNSNSAAQIIFSKTNTASSGYSFLRLYINSGGAPGIQVRVTNFGSVFGVNASTPIPVNTWAHVAAVRIGTNISIFVNGVLSGTASNWATYPDGQVLFVAVGGESNGAVNASVSRFNGYIDELRITKGVARYTANFTPPDAPFPDVGP